MKAREEFKPFDVTEYLGTAEDRAAYLRAMWEDSSGDPAIVATALGDVARALGMSKLARDTGVAREALYKALSARGNPELGTITKVLRALGLELTVRTALQPGELDTSGLRSSYDNLPQKVMARDMHRVKVDPMLRSSGNVAVAASKSLAIDARRTTAASALTRSDKRPGAQKGRVAKSASCRGGQKR